ncbi:hypothetical protein D046_6229B, partial [Vibrio parahaemolyticus V-223/04]
ASVMTASRPGLLASQFWRSYRVLVWEKSLR